MTMEARKIITGLAVAFSVLFLVVIFFIWQEVYLPQTYSNSTTEDITIQKGQSLIEIASQLERAGVLKHRFWFEMYVVLTRNEHKLQAGEYELTNSQSVAKIAGDIITGSTRKYVITIPEGWNMRDIANYLQEQGIVQKTDFFAVTGSPLVDYSKNSNLPKPYDFSSEYAFLRNKPQNLGLEGYLFPDTYYIAPGTSVRDIVRMMLDNFDKKLTPQMREDIKSQNKSIFDIMRMASIIVEEVPDYEDKQIVSGILWKRLEAGIPLQVDASIAYITDKKTSQISKEETKIDSPYNTYKYAGLPLGPISNPGSESIMAAIYPKQTDYWYYLSTPDGQTIFSRTLEEHNIAKAKYLR